MHISGLAITIGELRARVIALERDMSIIKNWAIRFCILLALWLTAVVSNMNAETVAQIIIVALKSL